MRLFNLPERETYAPKIGCARFPAAIKACVKLRRADAKGCRSRAKPDGFLMRQSDETSVCRIAVK